MAESQVTQGAIDAIFNDPNHATTRFPVPILQCLQIKTLEAKAQGGGPAERYRVVLSDIRNYVQCMLATQANRVVHDGLLQRGCIVRMKSYQAQSLKGKNVLIILDLDIIESLGAPEKIGDPVAVETRATEPHTTTIGGSGFYGAKEESTTQEVKPQVPKQLPSRAGAGGGGAGGPGAANVIYPIEALSPYAHKWTIKARVTSKSDIKTWHKASGEGKLFSVNLLDESGEIRATGFNDQLDSFYELLQEGNVYYISSPCKVQLAKKQFSNLPNDYELTFERDTVIEKAEDQANVPQIRFNFCNIEELKDVEKDATVDIVGVLKEVEDVTQIVSKTTQKPYDKRELVLVDDTGYSVRVTIWGKTATNFDAGLESIVAFKGTRVSDFGGRSLSLLSSGTMSVDPDIPEAHRLKGWYDASGRSNSYATHSNLASMGAATGRKDDLKTISEVKDENLGMDEPAFFSLKATVVHIRQENFCYPACRSEGCNKKVTDMGDGTWRCEKCNVSHDRPEYRYIMSVNINDHTGQLWLSCFDETARLIMGGRSADEMVELRELDDGRFVAEFEAANCRKLNFRCRAKMDTYGDQQRIRYQVLGASLLDYKSEAHKLADLIKLMNV
ncbi:putative single-stranded DNA-binding protein 68k chain [Lasiosphaeria miniovina]|uniref:Replication protein A subunit n=1 Tax=Lasiosphaeria miniovina TaxID=1954250 RepID=A0AA40B6E3_9PEZI|nr:putative single-stranded DNA-binding protein 68k chain [Lasiosphaeria miniovina]KAK0728547.1 putative single-stranded DNA-binding protein 68k chain [Lasiosphaeria miniovina]